MEHGLARAWVRQRNRARFAAVPLLTLLLLVLQWRGSSAQCYSAQGQPTQCAAANATAGAPGRGDAGAPSCCGTADFTDADVQGFVRWKLSYLQDAFCGTFYAGADQCPGAEAHCPAPRNNATNTTNSTDGAFGPPAPGDRGRRDAAEHGGVSRAAPPSPQLRKMGRRKGGGGAGLGGSPDPPDRPVPSPPYQPPPSPPYQRTVPFK